jgi:hypothetical protein
MFMKRLTTLVLTGLLMVVPALQAAEKKGVGEEPVRDEQVVNRLAAMGNYLRSLKVMAVQADTTTEDVMDNGQKLQFAGSANYLVQTPNHLRLVVKNDRHHRVYTYDGKALTQFSPGLGYYSTMEMREPIGRMVLQVKEKYDLELPLADLFLWGTEKADTTGIMEAVFVGLEQVGDHDSEHFAFREDGIDWQIWIRPGDQPLPDRLVITTTDDPAQPSYTANLMWNLNPQFKDTDFSFVPPKGAMKIDIVAVDSAVKQ